ncbi:hypothetical protein R3X27_03170 [Tropicimonas sp. TH_r6]|uniref:hypothetical protein n=1 Tax=Tropicimonas sp. TH_r6 TaxID=3082085 RepID=UPI0029540069|nr:hypothetical protein [Tropicimonas sp. TH_r6]MDV7141677.1 hypothetical protein [Tropicimonas sp. TH_r6]
MRDPQFKAFSGRLRRIEKTQRRGGGFEAAGTLGQSHYTRVRRRSERRSLLRPALTFVSVIILMKGGLLAAIGETSYSEKLANLLQGNLFEQFMAYIMAIDPVSKAFAQLIAPLFG